MLTLDVLDRYARALGVDRRELEQGYQPPNPAPASGGNASVSVEDALLVLIESDPGAASVRLKELISLYRQLSVVELDSILAFGKGLIAGRMTRPKQPSDK